MPDGFGQNLVVARQRAELFPRRLIKIAESIGRDIGIEPVGLRKYRVERDHDCAKPRQVGDDVGDPRPRPRPLAKPRVGQALFVDIDDGDGPHGLHARVDELKGVKRPDPKLLDRGRIEHPQRGEADQERQADQPRIADPPLEPSPYDFQPLHALPEVWLGRSDYGQPSEAVVRVLPLASPTSYW